MTSNVHINKITSPKKDFLDSLYKGDLYIETALKSSVLLCDYAQECI